MTGESELERIVRAAWDALSRRDLEAFLRMTDPEVRFRSLVAEAEGVEYRGHDGVRQWWTDVIEFFDDIEGTVGEIRPLTADRGLLEVRVRATLSEAPVTQMMWQTAELRNGRLLGWDVFRTEAEAVAALGAG